MPHLASTKLLRQLPAVPNHCRSQQGAGGYLNAPPAQRCWPALSPPGIPDLVLLTHAHTPVSTYPNSCQPTARCTSPHLCQRALCPYCCTILLQGCTSTPPCTGIARCPDNPTVPPQCCAEGYQCSQTSHWARRAPQHARPYNAPAAATVSISHHATAPQPCHNPSNQPREGPHSTPGCL